VATTRQRSFRLSEQTLRLLEDRARVAGESSNRLAQRLLDEGLRLERHPLIYFREGAAGRRPALVGTRLDVWQIVETVRANDGDTTAAAEFLAVSERQITAGVDYYADFKLEVDAWAQRQREIAAAEEEAFRRRQAALE
jgi:uncharacterized protein (DUF433 family)